MKCVKAECTDEAKEDDLYCAAHVDAQVNAIQTDFLLHYRGGMNFRLAAKRSQVTTTQIKDWIVTDLAFAASMKEIHEERIFEAKRALIESLPDVIDALIANAKGTKATSISAARLVLQAAGVKLPELRGPKVPTREKAEPSKEEIFPSVEAEIDPEEDDSEELADIAKGIL